MYNEQKKAKHIASTIGRTRSAVSVQITKLAKQGELSLHKYAPKEVGIPAFQSFRVRDTEDSEI